MNPAEIQRLRAEVKSDRAAFDARLDELSPLNPMSGTPAVAAQIAVARVRRRELNPLRRARR